MAEQWVAGFRSAVISPYEEILFVEPRGFRDQTVRQVLRMAGGGEGIRVRLSNRYGRLPLTVAEARVAVRGRTDGTVLRFAGAPGVTVPAGAEVVSDAAGLSVAAGDALVLSLHLPAETGPATFSHMPAATSYVADGNVTGEAELAGAQEVEARFYVTGVDVLAPAGTAVGVAFGDSWFEGVGTTPDADRRSVDALNRRLERGWVVNQGIAGNRLLTDGIGEHALARFERDVLSVPGATAVLVHFGINDLGLPGMTGLPPAPADDLIMGFTELARRAHWAGLAVHAATIGPFAGAVYPGHSTPEALAARRRVNEWIRTSGVFESVFDVARALEDPGRPGHLRADFDCGDGMHPNDEGARAMAATVDLAALGL
ncbi:GDSL-type esterase/lipase family protein [Streptomyces caatingaensis]|uniref:GDSL family lipase n=1 Tax=Streptomyces caatingaensis TaxID=1678637 RepID=A0A0K9XL58_9ACTN|nr:GDSL-type esterase/lipase family protein [Streptomyces caatingaensis]KNB54129.1 GDSL family lipase [Streptomyces caatingaensis]